MDGGHAGFLAQLLAPLLATPLAEGLGERIPQEREEDVAPQSAWQNDVAPAMMLLRKVKPNDLRLRIKAWLGTSGASGF